MFVFSAQSIIQNDSNWAGYIVASDFQNPSQTVTAINASWVVPQVKVSENDSFSAVWIGIGGYFDHSLLQIGSEQDSINGTPVYNLWFEMLPQNAITIEAITVSPGDTINASIALLSSSSNLWSIYIADGTQVFQDTVQYPSTRTSAEWILERPSINQSISVLANVSSVTFSDCFASISNQTQNIGGFPSVQSVMFQHVQNKTGINQLTYISNLTKGGSSFIITTFDPTIPEFTGWLMVPLLVGTFFVIAVIKKYAKPHVAI